MAAKDKLSWSDLESPTMSSDEYLKIYKDKIEINYKTYEPKREILNKLNKFLEKEKEALNILALGADWCPDCNRNIPRLIKIIKKLNNKEVTFKILYGIMKDAFHKPNEPIWHKKRSPKEALNPKFDLKAIPTIYFFNKKGDYLGSIIENPKEKSTIEEDMLEILQENL
ncbi:MAG: thioredoxin family protein [Candidatus Hodarchaeota archaeon]